MPTVTMTSSLGQPAAFLSFDYWRSSQSKIMILGEWFWLGHGFVLWVWFHLAAVNYIEVMTGLTVVECLAAFQRLVVDCRKQS